LTFNTYPRDKIPDNLQRPELRQIRKLGYNFSDPGEVITMFEKKVATFAGSKYAVATDSCSHALFLSLKYLKACETITIPSCTYISVPMQIIHSGCKVAFNNINWQNKYQLSPLPLWDGAAMWQKNMYSGGLLTISFQYKKAIPIGKGGMILTDDIKAYTWLKLASHDGRNPDVNYAEMEFSSLGYHFNMTPEDAARGIMLMDSHTVTPKIISNLSYTDISNNNVFKC